MIEQKSGHNLELTTLDELVDLRFIYKSLKDGVVEREYFFEFKVIEGVKEGLKKPSSAKKIIEQLEVK